jgi:hypothetical protein
MAEIGAGLPAKAAKWWCLLEVPGFVHDLLRPVLAQGLDHVVALLVLLVVRVRGRPPPAHGGAGFNVASGCSAQSSEGCLYRLRSTRPRKPTCGKELDEMGDTAKEPGVWPWPDSLDAVVAASGSHRVVLENELTRVLEVIIAPGEREPEHTHRWPSVMVVHRPAPIRYYTGDTLTFTSSEQPSSAASGPRVSWLDPEGPHSVENIDGHPCGAFRIELKQH